MLTFGLEIRTSPDEAVQLQATKRSVHGIQIQASYVYGKTLTNVDVERGLDALRNNASPSIEKARAPWDLTHAFKLNHYIPIPAGKGHMVHASGLNWLIENWALSGFVTIQSGAPVSILSSRGTLNRSARSGQNTVNTSDTLGQLNSVSGLFVTGIGPYFMSPSVISANGTGTAPDGSPAYQGQGFFNPSAGTVGSLQRRALRTAVLFWGGQDCGGRHSLYIKKYLMSFQTGCMLEIMATPRPEPVQLHEHAMDNLRYIRRTLERAGEFTAVPGIGGMLMGSTALVAAWIAGPRTSSPRWLAVWLLEAVVALLIGMAAAAYKAKRVGIPLLSGPGRKFVAGFAPAMAAGAVLTLVLFRQDVRGVLPGIWLLLYGTAVVSGGAASVRVVPAMGALFMLAGVLALLLPVTSGDLLLAAGFGGFHIVFGTIIAVKYGG